MFHPPTNHQEAYMNKNITSNSSPVLERRGFLMASAGTVAWLAMGCLSSTAQAVAAPHALPTLPYAENALEPIITARTIGFHYGKHHKAYVDNLHNVVMETEFADLPLEKIITGTAGQPGNVAIFNNAAQIWNHSLYWKSMSRKGGGEPPAALKQKIEGSFGSVDACRREFATAAVSQFGSGWVWLVVDGDKLKVIKTPMPMSL
jgi:Fe-Mn family superoxide dismutase